MKTLRKRMMAVILAASIFLALTGCGDKSTEEVFKIDFRPAPAYDAVYVSLPVPAGELIGCCTDGKYMYILADEKRGDDVRSVLCRVDLSDGTAVELPDYQPSNAPSDTVISRQGPFLAPDGTLWLYEIWYVYHYDLPADFDPDAENKGNYLTSQETFHHLRQLDPGSGREKKIVDLSEAVRALETGGFYDEPGVAVDRYGNVYFAWNGGVAVLDQNGNRLFTLEAELTAAAFASAGGRLALLPDGTVAALVKLTDEKRSVRTIDLDAKDWGEKSYPFPSGVSTVFNGRDECLFCYIQDDVLYGMAEGDVLPQRLLPLADTRIEGYGGTACFALLPEGRAAILVRNMQNGGGRYETEIRLALLSPADRLPEDSKTKIVYGAIGNSYYAKNRIEQFNQANDTYYIEYRDYTEGGLDAPAAPDEFTAIRRAARLRLQAEIAAGNGPDIFDESLPLEIYANAGYLEDLWPYIDNDPEINREGLMCHVLECAETDGKLCVIGSAFSIETAVTSRAAAGDRVGWTLDELLDAYGGNMPELYFGQPLYLFEMNASQALQILLESDLERYLDWKTGTCRFDSEDFKNFLRLCASAGNQDPDYEEKIHPLWEGVPALCQATLDGTDDLVNWDIYFGGPETLSQGAYEQQLWDAGVLYTFISEYTGEECTNYSNAPFVGALEGAADGRLGYGSSAVTGMPDREIYAAFPGVPASGTAGSGFALRDQMAVSASSQVKDGAWEFLRSLLLPGGYLKTDSLDGVNIASAAGFPLNRAAFDALVEPKWCRVGQDGEIIPDQTGQPIEAPVDDWPVFVGRPAVMAAYHMAPTEAQMDRFWKLYDAIGHMSGGDEELLRIIAEQAQPYFAGDKSLDETADLIQRRVTLYINENR